MALHDPGKQHSRANSPVPPCSGLLHVNSSRLSTCYSSLLWFLLSTKHFPLQREGEQRWWVGSTERQASLCQIGSWRIPPVRSVFYNDDDELKLDDSIENNSSCLIKCKTAAQITLTLNIHSNNNESCGYIL